MKSTDKLFKLADRFARKISLGQQSLQPGEIANILQGANLWDKSAEVAPMINAAGIPDAASIAATIHIDQQFNCKYLVEAKVPIPPAPEPLPPTATPEEKATFNEAKKARDVAIALQKTATAGGAKLSNLLAAKYGASMKSALAKSGKTITDTMDVKWLTF